MTIKLKPAETLTEAFNSFDPARPLSGEYAEAYYVPRPEGADFLISSLRDDVRPTTKWLFTGHWGSGKSTELLRLTRELSDQYFTVYYTAEKALDLADLEYPDVLLTLGLQLYRAARERGVRVPTRREHELLRWYSDTIWEETKDVGGEASAELKADVYFAKLSSRLGSEAATRKTVRKQVESNLSDLIERINDLLADISKKLKGQQILVVIDGLDKIFDLDAARKLYYEGGANLILPNCKVVYTVPLALFYSLEFGQVRTRFGNQFPLPNVKFQTRDGQPYPPGREMLRELLHRRMSPALISDEAAQQLVTLCGGVPREFVALARDACANARERREERVEMDDVERAASKVRNSYRRILELRHYRELWQVHSHPLKQHTNSETSRELIHNLSLLEYRNDDSWWDVYPVVLPLLEERAEELSSNHESA